MGVVFASGCWSAPDLIDGAFTKEQWTHLQTLALPPAPDPCDLAGLGANCTAAITLAADLFVEPALSVGTPTSCQTCHDPNHAFIDSRANNNVSLGAGGWTKRNAITLLDVAYKEALAPSDQVFTWSGQYQTAGAVIELAITKAMASNHGHVASVIRASYAMAYITAFGAPPDYDDEVFGNLELAFDAYLATSPFVTQPTPFDAWLLGQPTSMSESAKRGFAIFVGRGTCIECHNGPLFSDLQFHDTGAPQSGPNVLAEDDGRATISMHPADTAKFLTGPLRQIAGTGPYMHDGSLATLTDVIDFYRRGGDPGYAGTRDPRIEPLDLTDDDAQDLEEFLRSLSDSNCPGTVCAP